MSKLMTDSATLMSWLEPAGDCRLDAMIEQMKQAIVDNTELQIEILDGDYIDKLQGINHTTVWVLRDLQKVREELKDLFETEQ